LNGHGWTNFLKLAILADADVKDLIKFIALPWSAIMAHMSWVESKIGVVTNFFFDFVKTAKRTYK
jgi:hypothetical protein